MATGTSTQYPSTSMNGAIVVPPRARSANPIAIVASAATQSANERNRGVIRVVSFPAAESAINAVV